MINTEDIKLYNGDCLEIMDILIKQGIKVDMILTDPPYGTTACKWDNVIPINEMWKLLKNITTETTPILLFGSEPFSSLLRTSNLEMYKYDWKWDKVVGSNFVQSKKQPLRIYEDICVFYKKQPKYFPIMEERKKENERPSNKPALNNINGMTSIKCSTIGKMKYPVNKIKINRMSKELNSSRIIHPTQKPIELLEYLIKTYTNENDVVLDFTMGSGSTGVACKNLNRRFIGIELDNTYFEIAEKRILSA